MSDQELTDYVGGLAERVPHVEAPLGALVAAGRRARTQRRRRRGGALLLGAVAAVAAVTLGPSFVVQQAPIDELAGPGSVEPVVPVAPDGMKLVGVDGVVIAVPKSWVATVEPFCEDVAVPSYYVVEPEDYPYRCPSERGDDPPPADLLRMGPVGSSDLSCKGMGCPERLALDGIVFEVRISSVTPGRDVLLATMRDSLQRLPEGFTTVPAWPNDVTRTGCCTISSQPLDVTAYRVLLEEAGLGTVVKIGDADSRETFSSQGSVVAVRVGEAP